MGRPGLSLDKKFRRLAHCLEDCHAGFGRVLARGALELLWDTAYEACTDEIGDAFDVEAAAEWRGASGSLLRALLDAGGPDVAGFIEEGGSPFWPEGKPGTYRVHDLWDHAPEYARKRAVREEEREKTGKSIKEMRAEAGRKGASKTNGKRPANGRPVSGKRPANVSTLADQTPASVRQTDGQCPATVQPPAGTPSPAQPAPAPTPAPTPSQPGLAGDDGEGNDLVLLRSTVAEELGLPRMLDVGGKPSEVLRFFHDQIAAVGEETVIADCLAVAAKSTSGTPTSLAWFVGWLSKLPLRSVQ